MNSNAAAARPVRRTSSASSRSFMKSHRTSPAFVAAISRLMTCRQFPIGRKLLAIVANSSRISATQVQMRGFTLISSAQITNRKKENPYDIDQMPIKTDVPQPYIAWRMVAQQTPCASGNHLDPHEEMEGVHSGRSEEH